MANKQQSMQARKAQRQKAKAKGRADKAKGAQRPATAQPTGSQLQYQIATKGIIATARRYRKAKRAKDAHNGKAPTNLEILQSQSQAIEMMCPVHAGIEVATILVAEGKLQLEQADYDAIAKFDEAIVKIAEDIQALQILIEAEQTFEDFWELHVEYIDKLADMFQFRIPEMMEVMRPRSPVINQYVQEHTLPEENEMRFSMRIHHERLQRVAPKYRTIAQPEVPEDLAEEAAEGEFIEAGEVSMAELHPATEPAPVIKDLN